MKFYIFMVSLVGIMTYFLQDIVFLQTIKRYLKAFERWILFVWLAKCPQEALSRLILLTCSYACEQYVDFGLRRALLFALSPLCLCANTSNETGSSRSYKKYWLTALRNCSSLEIIVFFLTWLDGQGWGHEVLPWLLRQLLNEPRPKHFKRRS